MVEGASGAADLISFREGLGEAALRGVKAEVGASRCFELGSNTPGILVRKRPKYRRVVCGMLTPSIHGH